LARDFEHDGQRFGVGEAYIVPVDQPQARLVKSIFERVTRFADSLFYDVSTWTLPLAFDADYAALTGEAVDYIGEPMGDVALDGGAQIGGTSSYGYLMEWGRYFAPRALYRIQAAGFYPRLLQNEVTVQIAGESRRFSRGSIFIPAVHRDSGLRGRDSGLSELIMEVAERDHVVLYAVDTGLAVSGPDLGTPSATVLEQPRIALLTGSGSSGNNAGEVWHLLSERFGMPVSLLDVDGVEQADLTRYTTLIMAGGS
jgi:hypothetical protein